MSGNYFSKKEIKANPNNNYWMNIDHLCEPLCVVNELFGDCATVFFFIDASTEGYEEEGDYEEEEGPFDICANQGKLY